jgi:polar amino acid transport system substrate-binding protein
MAATAASGTTASAQETPPATPPSTLPQCATTGVLKIGSDATYAPFESVNDKTGKIEGFDIDLINAIAAKEGFTTNIHNALFDTIFTALSYGQYDLVISASTITDERLKTVNFSNPYLSAGQIIVVRKADATKISKPEDLAGLTVGVQKGTTGADTAKKIKNVKAVKEFDTIPEAFQALANKDLDAVINDLPTSLDNIRNNPSLGLVAVGSVLTSEFYGIAVRKDCTALLTKINEGLAKVIADGTYAKIYQTYLGDEPPDAFKAGGAGIIPTVNAPAATTAATAAATKAATTAPATAVATAAMPSMDMATMAPTASK